jgi:IBR domain, a half RING-finger domain
VACGAAIPDLEYIKAPCGHYYDPFCFAGLIQQAAIDEALYPPRCCKQPIPPEAFRASIPTEIWENFEKKSIEWTTPARDRRYCPWPMCSAFLGPAQRLNREMACPACYNLVCTHCQQPAHPWTPSCNEEDHGAMIDHLLQENLWQRCPGCRAVIELSFGCNHMTCRCGAEFCYECGAVWKTCGCEDWNMQKLFAEAERRITEEESEWKSNPQQGVSPLLRDLGNLRAYVPPTERRQARIAALADYLRNNHHCDHHWQQRTGEGRCGECGKSNESSLMVRGLLATRRNRPLISPEVQSVLHCCVYSVRFQSSVTPLVAWSVVGDGD